MHRRYFSTILNKSFSIKRYVWAELFTVIDKYLLLTPIQLSRNWNSISDIKYVFSEQGTIIKCEKVSKKIDQRRTFKKNYFNLYDFFGGYSMTKNNIIES